MHNRADHVLVTNVFTTRVNEEPESLLGYDEMKFSRKWFLLLPSLRKRECKHQNCIQPSSSFTTLTPLTNITGEVYANAHAFASEDIPLLWLSVDGVYGPAMWTCNQPRRKMYTCDTYLWLYNLIFRERSSRTHGVRTSGKHSDWD